MELISKLHFVLEHPFERVTYTDAINILKNCNYNKKASSSTLSKNGVLTFNRNMNVIL